MSYFGTSIKTKTGFRITVKIHGPLDYIEIEPSKIKTFLTHRANSFEGHDAAIEDFAHYIAEGARDVYCNGKTRVWVEVKIEDEDGDFYSTTAEKVTLDV